MDVRGKKILVIGSGISGINAASMLEAAGADFVIDKIEELLRS